ncbi:MAG: 16S rRNA (guanine(527)-N(7))-methyltransferase RsmG [Clostridia bacterium]|nr:16S rRNA (guanine(527)-N(7))-methyltransferase RsmG [Clostridia bacterium]
MTKEEFISECLIIFELNSLPCDRAQAQKLFALTERMLEVNKSLNLTAIKEEKAVILKHYADSVTVSAHIPQNSKIIDVGCGAGFPTLPLAIFRPDLSITALDGTAKRINYVSETAKMLKLDNVTALAARAEELGTSAEYREKYDVAIARAVASLPVLCELCLPFVKIGGRMIAMKSQSAEVELADASRCIEVCGGAESEVNSCDLVSDAGETEARRLIFINKGKKTPPQYPRHYSKISKKPL